MSSLMMLWTSLVGEKKLLFALCEVRSAEHPAPIGVVVRVDDLLKAGNCVRVPLKDFAALKTLWHRLEYGAPKNFSVQKEKCLCDAVWELE